MMFSKRTRGKGKYRYTRIEQARFMRAKAALEDFDVEPLDWCRVVARCVYHGFGVYVVKPNW